MSDNKQLKGDIILFDYYKGNNSPFFKSSSLGEGSYYFYE